MHNIENTFESNSKINWEKIRNKIEESNLSSDNINEKTDENNIITLKKRAKKLAKPLVIKTEEEEITVIEFSMAFENYGIEYNYIREIFPLKEIVPIPCTPEFVLGITNIRGQIISVIDLKKQKYL